MHALHARANFGYTSLFGKEVRTKFRVPNKHSKVSWPITGITSSAEHIPRALYVDMVTL